MAKSRQTKTKVEEEQPRGTCAEPIIKFNDIENIINNMSFIKYKLHKKLFSEKEITELLEFTTAYKQV